jgi:hypothetical protein
LDKNDNEEILKFQMRLFGNIGFVGELFRRGLIQESIILSIFDMLIAVETKAQLDFLNDMTVEGAVILVEKIGINLDQKKEACDKSEKLREQETGKRIEKLFTRFTELTTECEDSKKISNRIKLIIKNMLDNRATGW